MATPPTLDTPRLRLRPPRLDDADAIFAHARDPAVSRYVSWPRHRSIEDAHAFLGYAVAATEQGRECIWAIAERASARLVGTVGLRMQGHRVELGYWLGRPAWGTEAARAVVEWALAREEVDNVASAHVLEKIGMRREGRLARWAIMPNLDDSPRDCWCYGRVK
jgi:ribosomal-protein-alanine N-acetyltransferase